jgi:hypothetical protein
VERTLTSSSSAVSRRSQPMTAFCMTQAPASCCTPRATGTMMVGFWRAKLVRTTKAVNQNQETMVVSTYDLSLILYLGLGQSPLCRLPRGALKSTPSQSAEHATGNDAESTTPLDLHSLCSFIIDRLDLDPSRLMLHDHRGSR